MQNNSQDHKTMRPEGDQFREASFHDLKVSLQSSSSNYQSWAIMRCMMASIRIPLISRPSWSVQTVYYHFNWSLRQMSNIRFCPVGTMRTLTWSAQCFKKQFGSAACSKWTFAGTVTLVRQQQKIELLVGGDKGYKMDDSFNRLELLQMKQRIFVRASAILVNSKSMFLQ